MKFPCGIIKYFLSMLALIFLSGNSTAAPLSNNEAARLARQYIATDKPELKKGIENKIKSFTGDIDKVISVIKPLPSGKFRTGFLGRESFTSPGLWEKYSGSQLYYYVPEAYNPSKPAGLFIFLHGGGNDTWGEVAESMLSYIIAHTEFLKYANWIAVSPSAPEHPTSHDRWSIPGADDYIAAVITESERRFSIDPDRVVLGGHSMGGMGVFTLGLRIPDRFSVTFAISSRWETAFWETAIGTPMYFIHGEKDAVPPGNEWQLHRPKYTDVYFDRLADSLMTVHGVGHIYKEHKGGHAIFDALPEINSFWPYMTARKRNAFENHVVAATPADGKVESLHNRWVSITAIGNKKVRFDGASFYGNPDWNENLDTWITSGVKYEPKEINAGIVDAVYKGNNLFVIKTVNVKSFELWLHPKMVDFSKPVRVIVNGKEIVRKTAPSLIDALKSYERRHDWGLIYHACISFDL